MAPLRYAAKLDPFLSLDCAPTPSTPAQSKERKGSNFAIWQPCVQAQVPGHRDQGHVGELGVERQQDLLGGGPWQNKPDADPGPGEDEGRPSLRGRQVRPSDPTALVPGVGQERQKHPRDQGTQGRTAKGEDARALPALCEEEVRRPRSTKFKDVLVPERFDIAMDCAKRMAAGGGGENKSFLKNLMPQVRKATNVLKGQAIGNGDEALLEKFQTLRVMMEDDNELSMYLASDTSD